MIKCVCPNCGAELQIEEGREEAYCTYCGQKIVVKKEEVKKETVEDKEARKKADRKYMIIFLVLAVLMIVSGNTFLKTTVIAPILTVFGVAFIWVGLVLAIPIENRKVFGSGKGLFKK